MSFTIFDKVSNLKTLFLCSIPPQVNISSINYLQKLLNYLGYLQRFSIFPSRENVLGKSPEFSRPLFNPPTSFLNFFVPIHFGGKFSCQKSVTQDIRELGLSLGLNNCNYFASQTYKLEPEAQYIFLCLLHKHFKYVCAFSFELKKQKCN